MRNPSSIASYITALYGIANVKEILGIIILIFSILNILVNTTFKIYDRIKQKKYNEVPAVIEDTIDDLKNLEDNNGH